MHVVGYNYAVVIPLVPKVALTVLQSQVHKKRAISFCSSPIVLATSAPRSRPLPSHVLSVPLSCVCLCVWAGWLWRPRPERLRRASIRLAADVFALSGRVAKLLRRTPWGKSTSLVVDPRHSLSRPGKNMPSCFRYVVHSWVELTSSDERFWLNKPLFSEGIQTGKKEYSYTMAATKQASKCLLLFEKCVQVNYFIFYLCAHSDT